MIQFWCTNQSILMTSVVHDLCIKGQPRSKPIVARIHWAPLTLSEDSIFAIDQLLFSSLFGDRRITCWIRRPGNYFLSQLLQTPGLCAFLAPRRVRNGLRPIQSIYNVVRTSDRTKITLIECWWKGFVHSCRVVPFPLFENSNGGIMEIMGEITLRHMKNALPLQNLWSNCIYCFIDI